MVAAAILKNQVYWPKAMFARSPPRWFMKVMTLASSSYQQLKILAKQL